MFDFLNTWLSSGGWWVAVLLVVAGFALLLFGADWLVNGASGLAKKYGVSNLVIGLTVVAFGTSMPEFVVNMVAASQHNSEIAITNILGSNIINIFLILGCTAPFHRLRNPVGSTSRGVSLPRCWSCFSPLIAVPRGFASKTCSICTLRTPMPLTLVHSTGAKAFTLSYRA